jgi:gamma-glutamylaminecyclotransferase
MRHRLFVYGTLLSGQSNHGELAGASFCGPAATCAEYALLDLGSWPALRRGGQTSVRGEVYLVDDMKLAALDRFEGHPDLFERATIALAGGGAAEAYLVPARGLPVEYGSFRVLRGGDCRKRR